MFEQEKMEWLNSIHAVKLPEPVIYVYTIPGADGCYLLSERGIREKSVEELQELYFKAVKTRLEWRGDLKDEGRIGSGKAEKDAD